MVIFKTSSVFYSASYLVWNLVRFSTGERKNLTWLRFVRRVGAGPCVCDGVRVCMHVCMNVYVCGVFYVFFLFFL